MILSICIPTFNRIKSLDDCLNSILIASQINRSFNFEVCISDNCSSEKVENVVEKYTSRLNIRFNKNSTNLGFAVNAINSVKMANGSYVWLIGNDDLLLPDSLLYLEKIISNNLDVEYFFINSFFLNSKQLAKFDKPLDTREIDTSFLNRMCRHKKDSKCSFWDVIHPDVSWDFLIGIFFSVFKKDKWLKNLNVLDPSMISAVDTWSNFDNTCIHPKVLSASFKNSTSYICSKPLSINLIGEREWFSLYEFIEIVRIPELIDFYRSIGMPLKQYLYCKNFSLRNFTNYFLKIIIEKNKGLHLINFKKHFFKNLYFPNVYFSIFYYIFRKIKNLF